MITLMTKGVSGQSCQSIQFVTEKDSNKIDLSNNCSLVLQERFSDSTCSINRLGKLMTSWWKGCEFNQGVYKA